MNKNLLFFVSDLHGKERRYENLFSSILAEKPGIVLIGGDLLPSGILKNIINDIEYDDFIQSFIKPRLIELKGLLKEDYPYIGVIFGNDDPRSEEKSLTELEDESLLNYINLKNVIYNDLTICGYSFVPPTPFSMKDWERYDVSRFVDPGCTAPDEGIRTVKISDYEMGFSTIMNDIAKLTQDLNMEKTIVLFHAPPYNSYLDRAALDGVMVDHVPVDVHVGSIAIQRFIEEKQPFMTLHGHIHESSRITGNWRQDFGRTISFSAAYEGDQLALVKIDLEKLENAVREII